MQIAVVVLALFALQATGLELDRKTFFDQVVSSNETWLVYFYSPGCSACKTFETNWEAICEAIKLESSVLCAEVNVIEQSAVQAYFKISWLPTLALVNRGQVLFFNETRTSANILRFVKSDSLEREWSDLFVLLPPFVLESLPEFVDFGITTAFNLMVEYAWVSVIVAFVYGGMFMWIFFAATAARTSRPQQKTKNLLPKPTSPASKKMSNKK